MLRAFVEAALNEDAPWGDVTSRLIVPEHEQLSGALVAREHGVMTAGDIIGQVFACCGSGVTKVSVAVGDGESFSPGDTIATVDGPARDVLLGERVCLNLVQHLCGVATMTARFVTEIEGSGARITDTRKTTPGLRSLERRAVVDGGGSNHRFSLSDAVLVKDNHIAVVGGLAQLAGLREQMDHLMGLEVEIDRLDQLEDALATGCDSVLCDNFSNDDLRSAVELVGERAFVNASGGVTLETVANIASCGVDLISVGAITHSAPGIDIGLDTELA